MKSRKERRAEAKINKVKFEPMYNGESPISHNEYVKKNKEIKEKFKTLYEEMKEKDESEVETELEE